MPDEEDRAGGARPLREGFGDGQDGDCAGAIVVRAVADVVAVDSVALTTLRRVADVIVVRAHRNILLLERLVVPFEYADDVLRELSLGRLVHSQAQDLFRIEREGRVRLPLLRGR